MSNAISRVVNFACAMLCAGAAQALPTPVHHQNQFLHNVGTPTVWIDFEAGPSIPYTPGRVLPSGSRLFGQFQGSSSVSQLGDLQYAIPGCANGGCQAMIADDFASTSGTQYLGLDDPGNFNLFIGGTDTLRLGFPMQQGVSAVGLYLIASDPVPFGGILLDITIGDDTRTFGYGGDADQVLSDGGLAYFVGVSGADRAITAIGLRFADAASGTFLYAIDDILLEQSLPEPGSLALFVAAFLGLASATRRSCRDASRRTLPGPQPLWRLS